MKVTGPDRRGIPSRIETERLVLRCWREADAEMLREAIDSSLDHLREFLPWAMAEPRPIEETRERLRGFEEKFSKGDDYTFGIFSRDETEVLGGTGLHRRIDEGGLEIGYWIRAGKTRVGLATEAARALTEVALAAPEIERVQIHCDPHNVVSRRIPEKLGFRLIEIRPGDKETPEGEPRDTLVFEIRRDR